MKKEYLKPSVTALYFITSSDIITSSCGQNDPKDPYLNDIFWD